MTKVEVALIPEEPKGDSAGKEFLDPVVSGLAATRDESPENICSEMNEENHESKSSLNSSKSNRSSKSESKPRDKRYKPYFKLSLREQQRLDERNTRRALRMREERLACGLALAPYNTTQFLMEEHYVQEPDYDQIIANGLRHRKDSNDYRRRSNSKSQEDSSEEFYDSPEDETDFLQKEFDSTYEDMYQEYLNSRSRSELARDYIDLEDKIEEVEKALREARLLNQQQLRTMDIEAELEKIQVFREEIDKLLEENDVLRTENDKLRSHLPCHSE